jgi:hypothetical protein
MPKEVADSLQARGVKLGPGATHPGGETNQQVKAP